LLAEHLTSEYRVRTGGRGRTVEEWKLRLGGLENHWLDCLVGCTVGVSMNGAVLHGTDEPERLRVKVSFSERQRLAQQRRGWWGDWVLKQIHSAYWCRAPKDRPRRSAAGL
jgi:hypothetical protein